MSGTDENLPGRAAAASDPELDRLAARTGNGAARREALRAAREVEIGPTSVVEYRSAGRLLLVGDDPDVLIAAAAGVDPRLSGIAFVDHGRPGRAPVQLAGGGLVESGISFHEGTLDRIEGHLGAFRATVREPTGETRLGPDGGADPGGTFDLVLDLRTPARAVAEVPPVGYYAPGDDAAALERALAALPEMVGEFYKPRYFDYAPDVCVHGARGIAGCTRCLDACPAGAIASIGERIEVDPFLCQGIGSCASVCPTGAITYRYPGLRDTLDRLRRLLRAYRDAGGERPVICFHDADAGARTVREVAGKVPENVIPFEVEDLGVAGLDVCLGALVYGAARVLVLVGPGTPATLAATCRDQAAILAAALAGLGLAAESVEVAALGPDVAAWERAAAGPGLAVAPATFAPFDEKRTVLRLALDHLYREADRPAREVVLPAGAPFGEVSVDREACTLCMACVTVCPASALIAAGDTPRLAFDEWRCVQCGLCERACPEDAIGLTPRLLLDPEARRVGRVLNEDEPFGCVSCGKPFATRSVIERMTEKLSGHRMFQGAGLDRIRMCEDCRVVDIFREDRPDG